MPYPTVIPGGRFREIYYWDSYWTIRGLLASQMVVTAKNMILNLLSSVRTYGFVPNGGRIYYTTRSQPPFLTLMVSAYFNHTNDKDFVKEHLSTLDMEYQFWVKNRQVTVNSKYKMYQYRTNMAYERPESFLEDHETAELAALKAHRSKAEVFRDISSAAESGMDFSSRWMNPTGPHANKLYSIRTTKIVPVCLNSIMYRVAKTLHHFHDMSGNKTMADYYKSQMNDIQEAISNVLWDNSTNGWADYDLETNSHHYKMYATNFFPLWAGCANLPDDRIQEMFTHLNYSGYMDFAGGFSTSNVYTTQQWDMPNAWPPLQDIMIDSLLKYPHLGGYEMGMRLINKWIRNNYLTYNKTGYIYEKYSATNIGYPGSGGEYDVQVGFSWSISVLLDYLVKYGNNLTSNYSLLTL